MKNLNYLMDHILYQILRNYFGYVIEKHDAVTDNPPIRIYINKTENRTTFKIKTGYYLEFLMPEMTKVLGSNKNKTANNKYDENCFHLEITEVVLLPFNI